MKSEHIKSIKAEMETFCKTKNLEIICFIEFPHTWFMVWLCGKNHIKLINEWLEEKKSTRIVKFFHYKISEKPVEGRKGVACYNVFLNPQ